MRLSPTHRAWLVWWALFPSGAVFAALLWRLEIARRGFSGHDWLGWFHWAVPVALLLFVVSAARSAAMQHGLSWRRELGLDASLLALAVVGYVLTAYATFEVRHYTALLPRPILALLHMTLTPLGGWLLVLAVPLMLAAVLAAWGARPFAGYVALALATWGCGWLIVAQAELSALVAGQVVVVFYAALSCVFMPARAPPVVMAAVASMGLVCWLWPVPPSSGAQPSDAFAQYMRAPFSPAGGFDEPREEFSDRVHAVANGRVIVARHLDPPWLGVVVIAHVVYLNHERRRVWSIYTGLEGTTSADEGRDVSRGKLLGQSRHESGFALRWDTPPDQDTWQPSDEQESFARSQEALAFIRDHRTLAVPQKEDVLALIDTKRRQMRIYTRGAARATYEVAFGQALGQKRKRDDLKTPLGMYYVVQRARGAMAGDYGAYYGGYWIKLNYPNAFDADWGLAQGLVSAEQATQIGEQWQERRATLQNTALGSGIGFHSWIDEWPNDGPRALSWGCVVLHPADAEAVYQSLPEGAMVVLF